MNELNLSVYTNKGGESQVTMTAKFATHQDAVAFHDDIASICKKHSEVDVPLPMARPWMLLTKKA